ncbi:MAG: UPF0175 family protein [Halobacteria archaeon]|nr:UPF0175 family protein [Halobacteria archaeon]
MTSISARVPDEEAQNIEEVADLLEEDKSTTIRKALSEGLTDLRIEVAIQKYQSGEVSTNQAARIADVSISEWIQIAREHNLTTQISPEDLEKDVETIEDL